MDISSSSSVFDKNEPFKSFTHDTFNNLISINSSPYFVKIVFSHFNNDKCSTHSTPVTRPEKNALQKEQVKILFKSHQSWYTAFIPSKALLGPLLQWEQARISNSFLCWHTSWRRGKLVPYMGWGWGWGCVQGSVWRGALGGLSTL